MTSRIAVLASGSGSNLQSIIEHLRHPAAATVAEVVLVASNRATAGALTRASDAGIATVVLRAPDDATAISDVLDDAAVDLVVLAGYMRLVPAAVVRRYEGRMLNIHPALLPAFGGQGMYGMRVHEAVIASGARVSGATVHFVDEEYDRGPIAAQWPVPVLPGDTAHTLAARVLQAEHLLYPRAVEAVAAGRLSDIRPPATALPVPTSLQFTITDDPLAAAAGMDRVLSP